MVLRYKKTYFLVSAHGAVASVEEIQLCLRVTSFYINSENIMSTHYEYLRITKQK